MVRGVRELIKLGTPYHYITIQNSELKFYAGNIFHIMFEFKDIEIFIFLHQVALSGRTNTQLYMSINSLQAQNILRGIFMITDDCNYESAPCL